VSESISPGAFDEKSGTGDTGVSGAARTAPPPRYHDTHVSCVPSLTFRLSLLDVVATALRPLLAHASFGNFRTDSSVLHLSSLSRVTSTCAGIVGKYGTRYGASLRKVVKKQEVTQHSKFFCDFCGKYAVKRSAVGIWGCSGCHKARPWAFPTSYVFQLK